MTGATSTRPDLPQRLVLGGRYRLVERLGRGGSAAVWRGYDERLSRPVAVKVLRGSSPEFARSEARSLALLTHPHIAAVYDYGGHFLVTELVDGRSLARTLAGGPLAWPLAVRYCAQIASALAAAHARGLVHRDVTPSNIMLSATGAKLIDFGISARTGDRETDVHGDIRGTPPYAAPERLGDRPVAPSADVFALGVVLYRALSGGLPWSAPTATDMLAEQRRRDAAPLPPIDGLPDEVREACLACLARDASARPSANELVHRLQEAAGAADPVYAGGGTLDLADDPEPTRAMPPVTSPARTWRPHLGRWRRLAMAGLLVLGLIAGVSRLTELGLAESAPPQTMAAAPAVEAAIPSCAVSYQLAVIEGHRMTVRMVATNSGQRLPDGWRLEMQMASAPTYEFVPHDGWQKAGQALLSPPQTGLDPGASTRMTLTGTTAGATPLPAEFRVGDQSCGTTLLGATITPTPGVTPPAGPGWTSVPAVSATPARGANPDSPGQQKGHPGKGHNEGDQ
ncbi:MAG: serine/threonine-protein kinase [Betaproteobacteria bacterium]